MWLNDLAVKFIENLLLDFRVFDEHQYEILRRLGAGLRACKEECEAFINDNAVVIMEVFILEENAEEVGTSVITCFDSCSATLYNAKNKLSECLTVAKKPPFIRSNVPRCEEREHDDMRVGQTINAIVEDSSDNKCDIFLFNFTFSLVVNESV